MGCTAWAELVIGSDAVPIQGYHRMLGSHAEQGWPTASDLSTCRLFCCNSFGREEWVALNPVVGPVCTIASD